MTAIPKYHRLILVIALLLAPVSAADQSAQHYLERELLQLPTDGKTVQTRMVLAPYGVYRIRVSSPYDLGAIERGEILLLFDKEQATVQGYETGLYGVVNHVKFYFQGKGIPLQMCLSDKTSEVLRQLSHKTPSISVDIFPYHWWQSWHGTGLHPDLITVISLVVGIAACVTLYAYVSPDSLRRIVQTLNIRRANDQKVRIARRPPRRQAPIQGIPPSRRSEETEEA